MTLRVPRQLSSQAPEMKFGSYAKCWINHLGYQRSGLQHLYFLHLTQICPEPAGESLPPNPQTTTRKQRHHHHGHEPTIHYCRLEAGAGASSALAAHPPSRLSILGIWPSCTMTSSFFRDQRVLVPIFPLGYLEMTDNSTSLLSKEYNFLLFYHRVRALSLQLSFLLTDFCSPHTVQTSPSPTVDGDAFLCNTCLTGLPGG